MRAVRLFAFAAITFSFSSPSFAASPKVLNVSFPDPPSSERNVLSDNFLGISWELFTMSYLWGESPDTMPNALKNYLSNIRARMSNPLRIRVGGNSMDTSQYVPDQENMITLTNPDAYFNDVPCDFGPMLFRVMNAMADEVGEMEFIIGLSMRKPLGDDTIIQLTADSREMLGDRLDALLLGNEPDLYDGHNKRANYTVDLYIEELNQIFDQLGSSERGNLTDRTLIGGPTICCRWSLAEVLEAGMSQLPYKYYTIQRYPQHVCSGQTERSSNMTYFLSHPNVPLFLEWNEEGMEIAKQNGVPVMLTEYNSVACGGDPTVSPTFATSLWSVDVALQAASGNYSAVYLHTREHGITYNLFEPPSIEDYQSSNWTTGSTYYTMLVIAEIMSSSTSVVVDLNLDNSLTSYNASAVGYAVYDGSDLTRSKLVLINYDYPRNSSDNATQTFVLPADLANNVGVRYLVASNITEQKAISWAGQTVGGNGDLQGEQTMETFGCSNGCNVTVPGPGLAVVWLDPESETQRSNIYIGNSTIADIYSPSSSGAAPAFPTVHCGLCWLTGMVSLVALAVGL